MLQRGVIVKMLVDFGGEVGEDFEYSPRSIILRSYEPFMPVYRLNGVGVNA